MPKVIFEQQKEDDFLNKKYTILFRKSLAEENEFAKCSKYFHVNEYRSDIKEGSTVIGRYSVLPFYNELYKELKQKGSTLINSFSEHTYIADVTNWCDTELKDLTPRTWTSWVDLPSNTKFVLKGRTNSRKNNWRTHMFCNSKDEVSAVASRLLDDSLIGEQGIVVREFVDLKKFGESIITGIPITNEWRTFWIVVDDVPKLVDYGYYWANHPEYKDQADIKDGLVFAEMAANKIKDNATFFVIDIAEKEDGSWIVIELNDAQMSGLSSIDPYSFYFNLYSFLGGCE